MKIILEDKERIWLQKASQGNLSIFDGDTLRPAYQLDELRVLKDGGLLVGCTDYRSNWRLLRLTPLGKRTLRENSPYIDPLNKAGAIWHSDGSIQSYGILK